MNKQIRTRFVSLMLVLMLALTFMPTITAKAETTTSESEQVNFVLVVDNSSTMGTNDPNNYAKEAISMFIDMLPEENASVGIVSFGNNSQKTAYKFSKDFTPAIKEHINFIHEIKKITPVQSGKADLKKAVGTIPKNGGQSPIDDALLAGVDMLVKAGTDPDMGCVILLTDGDYKSFQGEDTKGLETAVKQLKKEGWSTYCLELDYAGTATTKASSHAYLENEITKKVNNGATFEANDASAVGHAFMEIINSYYQNGNGDNKVTTDSDGYATLTFDVPDLTSETNITISGASISGVQMEKDGAVKATFGNFSGKNDEKYSKSEFIVGKGQIYYNVKMILPEAGTWTVKVHGAKKSDIYVNNISFDDLVLVSTINPDGNTESDPLTKNNQITASMALTYNGQNIKQSSLGQTEAVLKVQNDTSNEMVANEALEWNDAAGRFEGSVDVSNLGKAGKLSVWTEISYGKGVEKQSDPVVIYTYNEPVTAVAGKSISDSEHYVHEEFSVPVGDLFDNPDNDLLEFKAVTDGEESDISAALNDDKTELVITGNRSGKFEGQLLAWDADMGEAAAASVPIRLEIKNHKMEASSISDMDFVAKYIDSEELDDAEEIVMTAEVAFTDEDQEVITYTLDVENPALADANLEGNVLTVTSKEAGSTKITISATDDDGSVVSETFTAKTTTKSDIEKARFSRMIKRIVSGAGIFIVLAIIAIIAIGAMIANTRIRGSWMVEITSPVGSYSFDINTRTDVLRKFQKKGNLVQVLDLTNLPMSEPAVSMAQNAISELACIQISGVLSGNGCKIESKNKDQAALFVNGMEVSKKQRLSFGEAEIQVHSLSGSDITVRISIM